MILPNQQNWWCDIWFNAYKTLDKPNQLPREGHGTYWSPWWLSPWYLYYCPTILYSFHKVAVFRVYEKTLDGQICTNTQRSLAFWAFDGSQKFMLFQDSLQFWTFLNFIFIQIDLNMDFVGQIWRIGGDDYWWLQDTKLVYFQRQISLIGVPNNAQDYTPF